MKLVCILAILAATSPALALSRDIMSQIDEQTVSPLPVDYQFQADGSVTLSVCYNWSCARRHRIRLTASDLAEVRQEMQRCPGNSLHDALQRVRIGIWRFEMLAQREIPILANDRGLNDQDADQEGRTDCVDNATNTRTFLAILAAADALPEWQVGEPKARDLLTKDVHWTATLIERASGQPWAVDSWFRPNGHLPFVSPLADWSLAHKPWEPPLNRYNPYSALIQQLCPRATARSRRSSN